MREALGSGDMDSRIAPLDPEQARILARPDLTASVPDIEWADAVLVVETELVDEMPILELRVRKGRRRNGVQVTVASSHPSALDREAAATVRFAPGSGEALLAALAAALGSDRVGETEAFHDSDELKSGEAQDPDASGVPQTGGVRPSQTGDSSGSESGSSGPGAEGEAASDPAEGGASELPHGDPVGAMGEAATEPDPGAPAPISGPTGEPGAMAGGPPGEQSEEGERPAAGVDTSSGDSGYAGGESAPESGADANQGSESEAGGERGVGKDDSTSSLSATAAGDADEQNADAGSGGDPVVQPSGDSDTTASSPAAASAGTRSKSLTDRGQSPVLPANRQDGADPVTVFSARAGADSDAVLELARTLKAAGSVVIIWGERLSHGPRGKQAVDALLAVAQALDVAGTEGSGLLEVPAGTNGRGLREVGLLPNAGPGFSEADGRGAGEIVESLASGESAAVILLHADPLATHPNRRRWEEALDRATFVVAFAEFLDGGIAEHADVILPAESYAEREGTVVHPDGRLQRLRQTVGHPGDVRPVWWQLEQILTELGHGTRSLAAPMVSDQIFKAVPFYEGLTLEEIGGRGVRWQERDAASKLDAPDIPSGQLEDPAEAQSSNGVLRLGTRPSLWTGSVTRHAPVLEFLKPSQTVELSPADAERLGVGSGTEVHVGVNGTRLRATASVRAAMPEGTAYLIEGTDDAPAGALLNGEPQTVEVTPS
jgi:hypothetical protein